MEERDSNPGLTLKMPLFHHVALKAALCKGVWAGPALGAGAHSLIPVSGSHSQRIGTLGWAGEQAVSGIHTAPGSPPAPNLWLKRPESVPGCLCLVPWVNLHTTLSAGTLAKPPAASWTRGGTSIHMVPGAFKGSAPVDLSSLHQAPSSSARTVPSLRNVSKNLFPESTPLYL